MKECGECSLCCKLVDVPVLGKPSGVWCSYADQKCGGCAIHKVRPPVCRSFECLWLTTEVMGEELKPSRCGIVLEAFHADKVVVGLVDDDSKGNWQTGEPGKLVTQMLRDGYVVWFVTGKGKALDLLLPADVTEADATGRAMAAMAGVM